MKICLYCHKFHLLIFLQKDTADHNIYSNKKKRSFQQASDFEQEKFFHLQIRPYGRSIIWCRKENKRNFVRQI